MQTLFNTCIFKNDIMKQKLEQLLKLLPPNTDPTMVMNLVKGMYELDKGYSVFNPPLFALYIPCLQPSKGLEQDREEVKDLINNLRCQGFGINSESLSKRKHSVAEST